MRWIRMIFSKNKMVFNKPKHWVLFDAEHETPFKMVRNDLEMYNQINYQLYFERFMVMLVVKNEVEYIQPFRMDAFVTLKNGKFEYLSTEDTEELINIIYKPEILSLI